jgi:hypothetical protein
MGFCDQAMALWQTAQGQESTEAASTGKATYIG